MYAAPGTDPFAKVAMHIGKLVDTSTNTCLSCGFQLKSGYEVAHYKVQHFHLLKAIVKRINDESDEGRMTLQGPNPGSGTSSVASTNLPPVSTPATNCGPSGGGSQQRPVNAPATVTPRTGAIKQELLPPDGDDDVVVIFAQAAAPFCVKSHGAGFRVLIRDTKLLSRENVRSLLSILVPPERAPAPDACPRLNVDPLDTGGMRIEVADTGLLTATQLAAVRRAISGTTDVAVDRRPQERMDAPFVPMHRPAPAEVQNAANPSGRRGRPPKDPDAPKRPMCPFFFWMKDNRARLTKPGMNQKDVCQAAGVEWNRLTDKSKWEKSAAEDQRRYEREMAAYKNK